MKCVDLTHNYTEDNMTLEIIMSKFHEATGLSKSVSPVLINWKTKPGKLAIKPLITSVIYV